MGFIKNWIKDTIPGAGGKVWDVVTDVAHAASGIPTAEEKRNSARMISDQLDAYKKQTAIAESEVATKKEQMNAEKRRLSEKMVRGMRNHFSSDSFGGGSADAGGLPETLGA